LRPAVLQDEPGAEETTMEDNPIAQKAQSPEQPEFASPDANMSAAVPVPAQDTSARAPKTKTET